MENTPSRVRIGFTVTLDLQAWAEEYGMTTSEARGALRHTAEQAMLNYLEDNGFDAETHR